MCGTTRITRDTGRAGSPVRCFVTGRGLGPVCGVGWGRGCGNVSASLSGLLRLADIALVEWVVRPRVVLHRPACAVLRGWGAVSAVFLPRRVGRFLKLVGRRVVADAAPFMTAGPAYTGFSTRLKHARGRQNSAASGALRPGRGRRRNVALGARVAADSCVKGAEAEDHKHI